MKCPVDNETLVIAERAGVEIDYCPKCRGVWLDRGELDKILERSSESRPAAEQAQSRYAPDQARYIPEPAQERPRRDRRDDDDDDDRHRRRDGGGRMYSDDYHHDGRPKRRESWLSEIFDF